MSCARIRWTAIPLQAFLVDEDSTIALETSVTAYPVSTMRGAHTHSGSTEEGGGRHGAMPAALPLKMIAGFNLPQRSGQNLRA